MVEEVAGGTHYEFSMDQPCSVWLCGLLRQAARGTELYQHTHLLRLWEGKRKVLKNGQVFLIDKFLGSN